MLADISPSIRTSSPVFAAQPPARSMQAAVITAPGKVEIETVAVPRPGPDEVLVKIEGCGVSACDLPYLSEDGEHLTYPLPPGYPGQEGWGWVAAVGSGVQNLAIGERVTMLSHNAYAEYDIATSNAVFKLPPLLDAVPFPSLSLANAVNVFRCSKIRPGDTVAIVGIGVAGALLTNLAASLGVQVIALSRRQFALDLACRLGATHALALGGDKGQIVEEVHRLTNGKLCNVVFEAVGKQEPLSLATELTAHRGQLVIAGYHREGLRQINLKMWNRRSLTVINAHTCDPEVEREGLQLAVEAATQNRLDPAPLCTHIFGLAELDDALAILKHRPDGFLKGMIML